MARKGTVVLLVDDDRDTREMYRVYLTAAGLTVLSAADGFAALALVRASRRSAPDIVVTDLAMPGMDGADLARRLRRDPGLGRVPIVAVSGQALPERVSEAREAGCNAVLLKPCLPDVLLGTLRGLLELARRRVPATG